MSKSSCALLAFPPKQNQAAASVWTRVLEAAARILERQGFQSYTTNAIAKRAGVSIGSLYQYFPGKDAITVALIERECARLLADVTEADSIVDYREAVNHLIHSAVAHQMRRPRLARLLDLEESRLPIGSRIRPASDAIHGTLLRLPQPPRRPL